MAPRINKRLHQALNPLIFVLHSFNKRLIDQFAKFKNNCPRTSWTSTLTMIYPHKELVTCKKIVIVCKIVYGRCHSIKEHSSIHD